MKKLSLSLVAAVALSSCAHRQALIVTGDTLESLGDQFLATAALFNAALEKEDITREQYDTFKEFALKFKVVYPAAVHLWELAVISNDALLQQRVLAMIGDLVEPLAKFSADIMKVVEASRAQPQLAPGVTQ